MFGCFIANCILELWRYSTSVKPCKCPMCSCLITKLVPDSSVVIQTGEEVDKILNKIKQYNRVFGGGLAGLFLVGYICICCIHLKLSAALIDIHVFLGQIHTHTHMLLSQTYTCYSTLNCPVSTEVSFLLC